MQPHRYIQPEKRTLILTNRHESKLNSSKLEFGLVMISADWCSLSAHTILSRGLDNRNHHSLKKKMPLDQM